MVFLVLSSDDRRRALRFALATGVTFIVAIAPFVASAPVGAFRQVLLAQAQRGFSGESVAGRLGSLSGLAVLSHPSREEPAAVVGVVVSAVGAALLLWRRGALRGGGAEFGGAADCENIARPGK